MIPAILRRTPARFASLLLATCAGLVSSSLTALAADWPQWRGPNRDGQSPEKGLLKEWPAGGPKLAWQINDAGSGYSTPAVVGDRFYLLGNDGLENESARAFTLKDGKGVWSTQLGKVGNPNQKPSFPAARSTPTIDGDAIFVLGSDGDLVCLGREKGDVRWRKNLRTDFGGKPGQWAYSESPLVDGNALVCTPGGADATVIALRKDTGAVIWKCPTPEGDEAAYSSPIVVTAGGAKQYVQHLSKGLVGIDAGSGKVLWRYAKAVSRYGANIPTPLAADGLVFTAGAGTGGGAIKLQAHDGAITPEQVYFEAKLPTAIGGVVKVGDVLFGTTGQALLCVDFATGKIKWEDRAIGTASIAVADGRLYLQGEDGTVALAETSSDGYHEKGRFTPPGRPKRSQGMEKAWTHPVIAHGRLLLRDHSVVWCYDVQ